MLFYILICMIAHNEAARILAVFPTPCASHRSVFHVLTQGLINQGHQVVVITPLPQHPKGQAPENLTEIDVHDLSFKVWRERHIPNAIYKSVYFSKVFQKTLTVAANVIDKSLDDEDIKDLANKNEKYFDLLLIEAWIRPALVWSHIFKAPVVRVSSFGAVLDNYEAVGGPEHPLLYPTMLQHRVNNLTLLEKVQELYENLYVRNMYNQFEIKENEMIRKHLGDDVPLLSELRGNVEMMLLNVHPLFEGNLPVPINVVHMGGVHLKPKKDLPTDLKSYLDSSKNGVVYISFGSYFVTSMFPPELEQMFVRVLSELPYDVLWKWHDIPGISDNIRISNWFPQSDLLYHPNIKLFITHGGLQSTDEAIMAGVPLLGMPIALDQWFNVDKYVQHQFGMKLDMETVTEDEFRNAIFDVIRNESYRNNIKKFRSLVKDVRHPGLQRAVWWISHLLRHRSLERPTVTSLAQYLELELLAIVAACVFIVMLLTTSVVRFLIRFLLKRYCLWFMVMKRKKN